VALSTVAKASRMGMNLLDLPSNVILQPIYQGMWTLNTPILLRSAVWPESVGPRR